MLLAEAMRIHHAQCRVVPATAFGDIVEQRSQVQQLRRFEFCNQLAAQRKLVGECRCGKAAQVAQYIQNVFVHGIHVKQIVLHLPGDATKGGNVAPQNAVAIHTTHGASDAIRLPQDGHE